jgi:hypothetical protein
MTAVRDALVQKIYRGLDPFTGLPRGLYVVDRQGWNSHHPVLSSATKRCDPIVVVEIGVWKGGSTITMAQSLKEAHANGVVIAVDTWLGSVEHWLTDSFFTDLAIDHGYPSLMRKFMNNVIDSGLTDYVLPIPLDSQSAASLLQIWNIRPDVIHLDGSHQYETVLADIKAWWPLLKPNGLFIGDDYVVSGGWPGVRQAFDEFFRTINIDQVENISGKCWIEKLE